MKDDSRLRQVLDSHDPGHRSYYSTLLRIGRSLRERLPWFGLEHLDLLADQLVVDVDGEPLRPSVLAPTSEGLGLVAAGVWGGVAEDRFAWRDRLTASDLREPTDDERAKLLAEVQRLDFVRSASWE